jgi:hypothetical protein
MFRKLSDGKLNYTTINQRIAGIINTLYIPSSIYYTDIKFYDMSYYTCNHIIDGIKYEKLNPHFCENPGSVLSVDVNYLSSSKRVVNKGSIKEIDNYNKGVINAFSPVVDLKNRTPKVTITNRVKQNNLDIHFAIRNLNMKSRLEDMVGGITEKIQAR